MRPEPKFLLALRFPISLARRFGKNTTCLTQANTKLQVFTDVAFVQGFDPFEPDEKIIFNDQIVRC